MPRAGWCRARRRAHRRSSDDKVPPPLRGAHASAAVPGDRPDKKNPGAGRGFLYQAANMLFGPGIGGGSVPWPNICFHAV